MATMYILVGLQGAGKSTYAEKLNKQTGAIIVSSDAIREKKSGSRQITKNDSKIFTEMRRTIKKLLEEGKDVIVDATNVTIKKRASYINYISKLEDIKKVAIVFNKNANTCVCQNFQRDKDKQVPKYAIYNLEKYFVYPTLEEGFDEIIEIK